MPPSEIVSPDSPVWTRILAIVASTLAAISFGAASLIGGAALDDIRSNRGLVQGMAVTLATHETMISRCELTAEKQTEALKDAQRDCRGEELRKLLDGLERRLDIVERDYSIVPAVDRELNKLEERLYGVEKARGVDAGTSKRQQLAR